MTQVVEEPEIGFEFSWRVSRVERDKKQFDESIWSPVFATVNNGIRYLWVLDLRPKGFKSEKYPSADKQPNISLFLWLMGGSVKESVEANYQLFIQGETQTEKKPHTFNLLDGGWGFADFCPQNEIETAEWVEFRGRIWLKESAFIVNELFPDPQFQYDVHKYQLFYEQIVLGDHGQGNGTGDIIIVVSDGTKMPCHQFFLRQASAVFETMFQKRWMEGNKGEVHIDDITPETLKQLLFFCYVDAMLDGWEENAVCLLHAAHKYDMQKVVVKCEKELAKRLELGNAVEMLLLALELNLKLLEMQATQMLIDNWAQVSMGDREKLGPDASLMVIDGFAHRINVTSLWD